MSQFTHFDEQGQSRMVDVSEKSITQREAVARGCVKMQPQTFALIVNREMAKGDVLEVARVAGIMGAKQTSGLIPMCHPLNMTGVEIAYHLQPEDAVIEIEATVRITAKTGVEMEALTAVTITALTIYDMCKAVDRGMVISDIRLLRKSGGKSGTFEAESGNSSLSP
ncbi:cyclic pyranopterin monophosphate synthase MoaC [candidate division KSB3 bacterium]|nr:cyclic pyranopterin monophosphate synthase MoaC [candidate division KSB3 bacterium]